MTTTENVFVKGKVYKTVGGFPATVLYVNARQGMVYAVHNRYKPDEAVFIHSMDGKILRAEELIKNALISDALEFLERVFSTNFVTDKSLTRELYNG